jgi:hypothetical protein
VFGRRHVKIAWEFAVRGVLWRLLPSAEGYIVGEDRDIERKSVSFFCVERTSGRVFWKDLMLDEHWWISLDTIFQNLLFVHTFASPDMPQPRGIFAIDLSSGKTLWSNDEMTLISVSSDGLYAASQRDFERSVHQLDPLTGTMIRDVGSNEMEQKLASLTASDVRAFLEYPVLAENIADLNDGARRAIERAKSKPGDITRIDCLKMGDTSIVGYQENLSANQIQPNLRQRIVIIDERGRSIFEDTVNTSLARALPDSFFCIGDFVYYVKEKKTLCAVYLRST